MPRFQVPLQRPAAPLLVVRLAQLETAGGHLVVVLTPLPEAAVLAGSELRVYPLYVLPPEAAAEAVTLTVAAAVTATVVVVAPILSGPHGRDAQPGHERKASDETKNLTRLSAHNSRP